MTGKKVYVCESWMHQEQKIRKKIGDVMGKAVEIDEIDIRALTKST